MTEWKPNALGILVPDSPTTFGPRAPVPPSVKKASKQYWLRTPRRRVTPGTLAAPNVTDLGPWELHNLEKHVIGRREEAVRVLLGVAVLRKLGRVDRDEYVKCGAARFQRGKGNEAYVAAHRFPGTPLLGDWPLPHFAREARLERALERPLEKTDYLPRLMNYADRVFESHGGCAAVAKTIGFVLHEQKPEKDIDLNLIRHSAASELFPAWNRALAGATQFAVEHEGEIQQLDPTVLAHVNKVWSAGPGDSKKAEQSIEVVQVALAHSLAVSITSPAPFMLAPSTMAEYAARLEKLGKGS
jgi:hypothetical protein